MERLQFNFSIEKYKEEKIKARDAIIMFVLMSIVVPLTVFFKHWYFALPIGVAIGIVLSILRWKRYKRVIALLKKNSVSIGLETIEFNYPGGKTIVEITPPVSTHINYRSNEIKSVFLVLPDKTKILFEGYENIEKIANFFEKKAGPHNVKYHHWFHKVQ